MTAEIGGTATSSERHKGLYRVFVVLVLSAAMAFSIIDRFALSLLFEPIKADLGLSDTQLGLLHGVAFGLFYATMGIPIAWLIDRWSRKWVIFWGIAFWSVMTALCGFARNYPQLLAARAGVGVGEATLAPAGYSLIADIVPQRYLATSISTFQMGALLGGGLAFLVGGEVLRLAELMDFDGIPLLASLAPWQLTFIALALPGLIFLALVLLIQEPNQNPPALETSVAPATIGLWKELRNKQTFYASLFCGAACLIAVNYANMTWMPSVLAREFNWSLPSIGQRFGLLMLITSPAGVLIGGLLADQLRRRGIRAPDARVMLLAAAMATILVMISMIADSVWLLFGIVGAVQFSTAMVIGTGPATVIAAASTGVRAQVSAVYVFMINIVGLGIGPTAVGLMSDTFFDAGSGVLRSLHVFSLTMCFLSLICLTTLYLRSIRVGGKINGFEN
mgnify:CR=1 FL=1